MTEQAPRIVQQAEVAYEAIRAINHMSGAVPAPVAYDVLGNLKTAGGYGMQQALKQLAAQLTLSLEKYDVYDAEGKNPAESVATATVALEQAASHAQQIGLLLEAAQTAINTQGYRK